MPPRAAMSSCAKGVLAVVLVHVALLGVLVVLRLCGLVIPFSVPTGGMAPAISAGDHVMMEGLTYLFGNPRRGEIVVFKTDGISGIPQSQHYVKRVVGEPGDHVRISEGKLFINDALVTLSNAVGEIVYDLPPGVNPSSGLMDVRLPSDCYYVLGDDSTNSLDSRFWGYLPRGHIIGRVSFCYWPLDKFGDVK